MFSHTTYPQSNRFFTHTQISYLGFSMHSMTRTASISEQEESRTNRIKKLKSFRFVTLSSRTARHHRATGNHPQSAIRNHSKHKLRHRHSHSNCHNHNHCGCLGNNNEILPRNCADLAWQVKVNRERWAPQRNGGGAELRAALWPDDFPLVLSWHFMQRMTPIFHSQNSLVLA